VLWVMEFARVSSFSFLVHSAKHGINPFCYLLTAILIIANGLIFQSFKNMNPQKHFLKTWQKVCKEM
jgi:hypothetical protein